ncbi:MAG: LPS export ABC transporter periplasmic protein LptC [Hyphomicrobiaceae bacterium]
MATRSIKIADAGERSSALRWARINTVFVRAMRWTLPVAAVALLSSYAIFMQRTIKIETGAFAGTIKTGTVSTSFDNLAMTDPSYEGYNKKDGSHYKVSAKKAITDLSRDKPIQLVEIDGAFEQRNGQRTEIKARRGLFDQKKGTLNLDGGIDVAAPNEMHVTLKSAVISTKTAEIISDEPVLVKMPAGQVRGNAMRLNQRTREVVFQKGVAAKLRARDNKRTVASSTAADREEAGSVLGFSGGSSDAPVDITSASLAIAEKQRTARFQGDVRAIQAGRMLEAPTMLVSFFGGASLAGLARASGKDDDKAQPRGRVQRITASDGVRLTHGVNQVRARKAIFDVDANEAQLSGDVKITGAANRRITARLATVDTTTRRIVLTGNVVASQADSVLRGNRLIYEPGEGRMQLASPAIAGAPRGSIFVRFKPPAASRKRRRSPAAGNAAFSTNPDAPIEITARSLDVRDLRSVARFDGRVRARQGDLVLSTPVLTAHYNGRIGLFAPPGGGRDRQPAMKLRFIRASRSVTISSGKDAKATGRKAEFDMVANTVTISGNVVLRRGRQTVRGETLVIDLKTGLSRMKNAGRKNNTARPLTFGPAPKITGNPHTRDCGGQMCAVFYPMDVQKEQARRKGRKGAARRQKQRKPRLDSGWSSSTSTN